MLFDLYDYRYAGLIGGRFVPEYTIKNGGVDELLVTANNSRQAMFSEVRNYFSNSIQMLPLNDRAAAITAYQNLREKFRIVNEMATDKSAESGDFYHMIHSVRIIPNSDGTYPFQDGDILGVDFIPNLPSDAIYAPLYCSNIGNLEIEDSTDPYYGYNGDNLQKINGEIPSDYAAFVSESGYFRFKAWDSTIYENYLSVVEDITQGIKTLMIALGDELKEI